MPMLLNGRDCSFSLMEKTLDGPNMVDIARVPVTLLVELNLSAHL